MGRRWGGSDSGGAGQTAVRRTVPPWSPRTRFPYGPLGHGSPMVPSDTVPLWSPRTRFPYGPLWSIGNSAPWGTLWEVTRSGNSSSICDMSNCIMNFESVARQKGPAESNHSTFTIPKNAGSEPWELFRGYLGARRGNLGSRATLEPPGAICHLGASWGPSWAMWGSFWDHLES